MEKETFNEKCDRVLNYLKDKPSRYIELLSWKKFIEDTGINKMDPVIDFLWKEMKYIEMSTVALNISPTGLAFISHNSFCKEQDAKEIKVSMEWYNREDAKQRFDDYPSLKRNKNWLLAIAIIEAILLLIGLLISHQNK